MMSDETQCLSDSSDTVQACEQSSTPSSKSDKLAVKKPTKLSKPHLPPEFIRELLSHEMMANTPRKSMIFTADFHTIRKQIVDCKKPPLEDEYYEREIPDATLAFEAGRKWNLLDASVYAADPPFACEIIRLGYPIDKKDAKGYTPLIAAFQQLDSLIVEELLPTLGLSRPSMQRSRTQLRGAQRRVIFIIQVLIKQHAALDITKDGLTPLHFACRQRNWDLITLLLTHGANPSPPGGVPVSTFLTMKPDKARFDALVKALSNKPRPPRLCPCFSGKTLEACHLVRQPYPSEFLCNCGSEKVFGRCCINRNMNTGEQWDPETNKIITREDPQRKIEDYYDLMELWRAFDGLRIEPPQYSKKEMDGFLLAAAKELRDEGKMDPAYAYAFKRTGLLPRPAGRLMSAKECKLRRDAWNKCIDDYIALGTDNRSQEEIELTVKLGINLGAYLPKCERKGCPNRAAWKDQDSIKFRRCGKCKCTVYCSSECQKRAWTESHKEKCGAPAYRGQPSPAQDAIDLVLKPRFNEKLGLPTDFPWPW